MLPTEQSSSRDGGESSTSPAKCGSATHMRNGDAAQQNVGLSSEVVVKVDSLSCDVNVDAWSALEAACVEQINGHCTADGASGGVVVSRANVAPALQLAQSSVGAFDSQAASASAGACDTPDIARHPSVFVRKRLPFPAGDLGGRSTSTNEDGGLSPHSRRSTRRRA